jgi:hypothetical protein
VSIGFGRSHDYNIRSLDREQLAASGRSPTTSTPPGVSGPKQPTVVKAQEARNVKKTISEQIAAFEATRVAKSARMSEIMEKASDEGVTLDAAQTEEYDTLETEVKSVDQHLVRLRSFEQANRAAAKPVDGATDTKQASEVRGGAMVTSVKSNLPKGTAFTRYAMSLMRSQGNLMQAVEISKQWHDTTPEVETVLRAAVAAGTTTDSTGPARSCSTEHGERVRRAAASADDHGAAARPAPGAVQRSHPVADRRLDGLLGRRRCAEAGQRAGVRDHHDGLRQGGGPGRDDERAGRFSSPSAEQLVRDDLTAQIAQFLDVAFIDPTKAANRLACLRRR